MANGVLVFDGSFPFALLFKLVFELVTFIILNGQIGYSRRGRRSLLMRDGKRRGSDQVYRG